VKNCFRLSLLLLCLATAYSGALAAGDKKTASTSKNTDSGSAARFNLKFPKVSPYSADSYRWESAHQTSDGGYIMISSDDSSGIVIAKTSASGKKMWERVFGYTPPNLPTSIYGHGSEVLETADGGFLATGELYTGGQSATLWIVRLTREGNTIWERRYNGTELGAKKIYDGLLGNSLVLNPDGSSLIGVRVWNGDYCILAKFDPSGALLWQRQFPDAVMMVSRWHQSMDRLATYRTIRIVRRDVGYLMAYNIKEPGESGLHTGIRMLQLDGNGETIWSTDLTKQAANYTKPMIHDLINTSDGGFALFGNRGSGSAFVTKFTPAGKNQWVYSIGGSKTFGGGIVELPNGNFALCATTDIDTGTALMFAKTGDPDPATGKRSLIEKKVYGTKEKSVHQCDSIQKTRDGGFILAGSHFIQYKGGNAWLVKVGADGNIPGEPTIKEGNDK